MLPQRYHRQRKVTRNALWEVCLSAEGECWWEMCFKTTTEKNVYEQSRVQRFVFLSDRKRKTERLITSSKLYFHKCQTDWDQVTSVMLIHNDWFGVLMPFSALSLSWRLIVLCLPLFLYSLPPCFFNIQSLDRVDVFYYLKHSGCFSADHWRAPAFSVF